jgi:hypothetical protein
VLRNKSKLDELREDAMNYNSHSPSLCPGRDTTDIQLQQNIETQEKETGL